MTELEFKEAIVDVCHSLSNDKFVGTYEGNVSYKNGDKIYITPTQTSKAHLTADQIITIDSKGNKIEGTRKQTSETPMHTKCYELRPDIGAVIHCHSPFATAYAQMGKPIVSNCSTEFLMFFGEVPCLKYGTPGTLDIISDLDKYIYDYDVVLLANHGILAVGKDPMDAYAKIASVEMVLKTEFIRRSIFGDVNVDLPKDEIEKLKAVSVKNRGYHKQ